MHRVGDQHRDGDRMVTRRGFTLMELTAVLLIMMVLAAISYTAYSTVRSEQADARAQVSLMAAVMAQRSLAASTGGFATDAAALSAVMGGASIVAADVASAADDVVSMRADGGGLWFVVQGATCAYTYVAPVDQRMQTRSGTVDGDCRADNPGLPAGL